MARRYEVGVFRVQLFAVPVVLMLIGAVMAVQRGLRLLFPRVGLAEPRIFYRRAGGGRVLERRTTGSTLRCVVFPNGDWALYVGRNGDRPIAHRYSGLTAQDANLDGDGMREIAEGVFHRYGTG